MHTVFGCRLLKSIDRYIEIRIYEIYEYRNCNKRNVMNEASQMHPWFLRAFRRLISWIKPGRGIRWIESSNAEPPNIHGNEWQAWLHTTHSHFAPNKIYPLYFFCLQPKNRKIIVHAKIFRVDIITLKHNFFTRSDVRSIV